MRKRILLLSALALSVLAPAPARANWPEAAAGASVVAPALRGALRDTTRVVGAGLEITKLPIGIMKSFFGAILPRRSMQDGFHDIGKGLMAPVRFAEELIMLPFNILKRI